MHMQPLSTFAATSVHTATSGGAREADEINE